jgi:hypothetical protein
MRFSTITQATEGVGRLLASRVLLEEFTSAILIHKDPLPCPMIAIKSMSLRG